MKSAIVWSQVNCVYCDRAKTLLTSKGYTIEERRIGESWTKQQLLESVPSARSVPQVFINDEHVGGFTELTQYFTNGA